MDNKMKPSIGKVASLSEAAERVEMRVRARAHERYIARGSTHGHDLEDWFEATHELLRHPDVNVTESETEILVNFTLSENDRDEIQLLMTERAILIWNASVVETDKQIFRIVQLPKLVDADSVRLEYANGVLSCAVKIEAEVGLGLKAIA